MWLVSSNGGVLKGNHPRGTPPPQDSTLSLLFLSRMILFQDWGGGSGLGPQDSIVPCFALSLPGENIPLAKFILLFLR